MPMNKTYTNPTNFGTSPYGGRMGSRVADFGAFQGMGRAEALGTLRGLPSTGLKGRRMATAMAGLLGSVGRTSQPLSKTFGMMGRNVTYGRAGLTGGLGMLALRNGANMMDRMKYGDYGGAMMSGALTAAAGAGAYASWMTKGALRSHFNNAASWILKRFR